MHGQIPNGQASFCCAGHPSGLQQDWTPGQNVKGKRGRKPKLVDSKERRQRKDRHSSEKQAVAEERSGSETSEHGETDGPSRLSSEEDELVISSQCSSDAAVEFPAAPMCVCVCVCMHAALRGRYLPSSGLHFHFPACLSNCEVCKRPATGTPRGNPCPRSPAETRTRSGPR